jgi:hypothetical protein
MCSTYALGMRASLLLEQADSLKKIHSIQWSVSGKTGFVFAWATGSMMGKLATGDAHNSPLEAQAMGISQDLANAYRSSGKQCPK